MPPELKVEAEGTYVNGQSAQRERRYCGWHADTVRKARHSASELERRLPLDSGVYSRLRNSVAHRTVAVLPLLPHPQKRGVSCIDEVKNSNV